MLAEAGDMNRQTPSRSIMVIMSVAWSVMSRKRASLSRSAAAAEYMLAGYGVFPDAARLRPAPPPVDVPAVDRLLDRCLLNFRPHAALLAELSHPSPEIA